MDQSPFFKNIIKFLRSPWWPACASALISPGLGQIVNRDYSRGFLLLFSSLGSLFYFSRTLTDQLQLLLPGTPDQWHLNQESLKTAVMVLVNKNPGMFLTFHLLIIIIWVFSIVDAYISAKNNKNKSLPIKNDHVNS